MNPLFIIAAITTYVVVQYGGDRRKYPACKKRNQNMLQKRKTVDFLKCIFITMTEFKTKTVVISIGVLYPGHNRWITSCIF